MLLLLVWACKGGKDDDSNGGSGLVENVFKIGVALPDHDNILGTAPLIEAVHVEIGERFGERIERIFGVILGTEQSFLFGGDRDKYD